MDNIFQFSFGAGETKTRQIKGLATYCFHTIGIPFKECRSEKGNSTIPKALGEW